MKCISSKSNKVNINNKIELKNNFKLYILY